MAVADDSTTIFRATATDAAGNVSGCSSSSVTYVEDSTDPTSAVTFPAAGAFYSPTAWNGGCASAGFCGTANDGSGIDKVELSIRDSLGNYYDGSSFSSAGEIYLTASGSTSWSYGFAASEFSVDGDYTLHVKATDQAGNVEVQSSRTFVFDSSPPSVPSLSFSALTNASATGQTVYFRPGAAGGFTVTASADDPHSGISGYGFPALGSGWSGSQSGADYDYSFTASASDPVEPNDVTAQNNAGLVLERRASPSRPTAWRRSRPIACDGCVLLGQLVHELRLGQPRCERRRVGRRQDSLHDRRHRPEPGQRQRLRRARSTSRSPPRSSSAPTTRSETRRPSARSSSGSTTRRRAHRR